jgi:ABC-type sugar transport system ATPase subunit
LKVIYLNRAGIFILLKTESLDLKKEVKLMKLEIQNITKIYEKRKILDSISFNVEEGELLSILGPSGTGKSTVLKIISGLIEPDKGRVFIDNKDVTSIPPENRGMGFVFQSPLLFPHMTVEENIKFGLQVKKWKRERISERVKELLILLQIEDLRNRMASEISGGQQQRASIARSLAPEPEILLMDEPFSSLDPELREDMGGLIKDIQKKYNLTVIFVTHDRNESMALSHKIALLLDGEIAHFDIPENIYYRPKNRKTALFMGHGNFIPGIIKEKIFFCPPGEFKGIRREDGPAELFIRPHEIKINLNNDDFTINRLKVCGREVIYEILKEGICLLVEDSSKERLPEGSRIGLIFPQKDLYFL